MARSRTTPDAEPSAGVIDASPTKDFFISMLVKDIELMPALSDLIDNAVDGARRARGSARYDDLSVRIELDREHFKIADNCGGIPVELARTYAFRFGRPEQMTPTPHSVGQFGVGMKRALFKLGRRFEIVSATNDSRFTVDVDVEEWRQKPEWQFEFSALEEGVDVPDDENGTTITVTPLHPSVAKDFALESFESRLREELERRHQEVMDRGLAVTVNGVPLRVDVVDLLYSDELTPAHEEVVFNGAASAPVVAKIWAGIAESSPRDAGWYVFCNGRLILGPDQTQVTGWGAGDEYTIPKYHNQFARFRGYVFFDSDDASRLPWNTTKTSVDLDSDVYRRTRQKMLKLMRPVIDFLNKLDAEKQQGDELGPLELSVQGAASARISDVPIAERFVAPKPPPLPKGPTMGNINYARPKEEILRVQKALDAKTYREVGERTFDYFAETELGE
jgi:hypothetical protein